MNVATITNYQRRYSPEHSHLRSDVHCSIGDCVLCLVKLLISLIGQRTCSQFVKSEHIFSQNIVADMCENVFCDFRWVQSMSSCLIWMRVEGCRLPLLSLLRMYSLNCEESTPPPHEHVIQNPLSCSRSNTCSHTQGKQEQTWDLTRSFWARHSDVFSNGVLKSRKVPEQRRELVQHLMAQFKNIRCRFWKCSLWRPLTVGSEAPPFHFTKQNGLWALHYFTAFSKIRAVQADHPS